MTDRHAQIKMGGGEAVSQKKKNGEVRFPLPNIFNINRFLFIPNKKFSS